MIVISLSLVAPVAVPALVLLFSPLKSNDYLYLGLF
jgi:hypothetical protein